MRFLLFLILARYAVRCDDESNYYVIEMPEDVPRDYKKPFRVYWNVPTMQCKSKKIPFDNLHEKYGIIQNKDDRFLGENIAILYDPGLFPALFKNESSGKFKFRNGGVPQEGALDQHLDAFKSTVTQSIPDPDFSGVAVIDFESWRPVFRQNFGVLVPYKDVSYEIERKVHWWWPKSWIIAEAKQRFEEAGRQFMRATISVAKQLRPAALWGYYGFPYCFNKPSNGIDSCPPQVVAENDQMYWLWAESTGLYPSVYSSQDLSSSELASLIQGRVKEASRLRRRGTPILPYFWYKYQDGGFLRELDLSVALQSLYKSNASGIIIWGSSHDVNTIDKCNKLKSYLETTLGPNIAKYTKDIHKIRDEFTPEPTDIWDLKPHFNKTKNVTTQLDPEFTWIPPENYTHDIIKNVEEELIKKGYENFNQKVNESLILDMLLNIRSEDEINKDVTKNEKKTNAEPTILDPTTEVTSTLFVNYSDTTLTTDSNSNTTRPTEIHKTTEQYNKEINDSTQYIDTTKGYTQEDNTTESTTTTRPTVLVEVDKITENFNKEVDNSTEYIDTTKGYTQEDNTTESTTTNAQFTDISQFVTTDSVSKKPRSVNEPGTTTEMGENLGNSTLHLLTPNASDEVVIYIYNA